MKSARIRILLVSLLLVPSGQACPEQIRVCVWQGTRPEGILPQYVGKFRGDLYLRRAPAGWYLINRIDVEEYLHGVLAREMSPDWPPEALKAQAVCSRTIALSRMAESHRKDLPYDIENSVFHQVYGSCEDDRVIKAVDATRGEVLTLSGELLEVFFHACCGGQTVAPAQVWRGSSRSFVPGVDDPYCACSPYRSWTRRFSKASLARILGLASIHTLRVISTDSSGRVQDLQITERDGKIRRLSGHDFRLKVNVAAMNLVFSNPSLIPSTRFSLTDAGGEVVLAGSGYGHGVGLCQWGARQMAQEGMTYRQILSHYYPGAVLEKAVPVGNTDTAGQ